MEKSREAFRTISEVADWLNTPTHVLRFWEGKFPEVSPVKRAGGRRYYRPADMALLAGIKKLLHEEGMTIRGVQKLLAEQGVKFVASLASPPAIGPTSETEAPMMLNVEDEEEIRPRATATVFSLPMRGRKPPQPRDAAPEPEREPEPETLEETAEEQPAAPTGPRMAARLRSLPAGTDPTRFRAIHARLSALCARMGTNTGA